MTIRKLLELALVGQAAKSRVKNKVSIRKALAISAYYLPAFQQAIGLASMVCFRVV